MRVRDGTGRGRPLATGAVAAGSPPPSFPPSLTERQSPEGGWLFWRPSLFWPSFSDPEVLPLKEGNPIVKNRGEVVVVFLAALSLVACHQHDMAVREVQAPALVQPGFALAEERPGAVLELGLLPHGGAGKGLQGWRPVCARAAVKVS